MFPFSPFSIAYPQETITYTGPALMGIINVTPDSFYDGKAGQSVDYYLKKIEQLIREGADMIDIGGESTRPGAKPISPAEEKSRVGPVLKKAKKEFPQTIFSIDTSKPEVAEECLQWEVDMLNDISAGENSHNQMLHLAVQSQRPIVLMHKQGEPAFMQDHPTYQNVVKEIKLYLKDKVSLLLNLGLSDDKIIVDPGLGFGKTKSHNLQILKQAGAFGDLSKEVKRVPVLIGASMKSLVGDITGEPPANRLPGTLGVQLAALACGASILRVHHVKAMKDAMNVYMEVMNISANT